MKVKHVLTVAVFFMSGILICFAIVGLFIVSGGKVAPKQEQPAPPHEPPSPELPVVVIDAGHGGEDGGAVGVTGLVEKNLNLDVAKRLAALLEAGGYRVIMTRTEDVLLYDRTADFQGRKKVLDLAARQAVGDAHAEGIFISIHANTFSQPQYHGLQIWYGVNDSQSARLAEQIRREVVRTLQPDNHRQSKQAGSNIYLMYHLQMPCVLVECGFLSNPAECADLEDTTYRQELALALYRGIAAYHEDDAT